MRQFYALKYSTSLWLGLIGIRVIIVLHTLQVLQTTLHSVSFVVISLLDNVFLFIPILLIIFMLENIKIYRLIFQYLEYRHHFYPHPSYHILRLTNHIQDIRISCTIQKYIDTKRIQGNFIISKTFIYLEIIMPPKTRVCILSHCWSPKYSHCQL